MKMKTIRPKKSSTVENADKRYVTVQEVSKTNDSKLRIVRILVHTLVCTMLQVVVILLFKLVETIHIRHSK